MPKVTPKSPASFEAGPEVAIPDAVTTAGVNF
jgi:hypothetical protein